MFASRKPLAIALAIVMLFAMLVPVAMAAPQWVHGVTITAPTTAAPKFVNPEPWQVWEKVNGVWKWVEHLPAPVAVKYTVPVVGIQVDNVHVVISLLQKYKPDPSNVVVQDDFTILARDFVPGDNLLTAQFAINDNTAAGGELEDGWYDLRVCVRDIDPARDLFCDTQVNAVYAQDSYPRVDLEKPGAEDWEGATFVMGQAYLMVGTAIDASGITRVEFQYCDASNWPFCWNKTSPSYIKIADGVPTAGVPNQWQATFDSSMVPDDFGYIRMCVWNKVGLSNCEWGPDPDEATWPDAHKVFVNNRAVIHLEPQWNLISTPLLPYDASIAKVLMHLIDHKTVLSVWAFDPTATPKWQSWVPGGPSALTTFQAGRGYWIEMAAEDDLTVVGAWKSVGNIAPPEYSVKNAWNLIGYTHWGWPTIFGPKKANDYLGSVAPTVQQMYRYDAEHETFIAVYDSHPAYMTLGAGYWLAVSADGMIRP